MTEGKEGPEVVGAIAEETPHPRREARQGAFDRSSFMFQSTYLPDDCTHFTASRSKGGDDSVNGKPDPQTNKKGGGEPVGDYSRSSGSTKSISRIQSSKHLRVGFSDELSVHAVKSAGSSQQGDDSTWRGFRILVPTCFLPKAGQKSVEEHGDATQSRAGLSTVTFEQSGLVCSPKTIMSPYACIGFILLLIVCCVAVMVTCGTGNCNYRNQRTRDPVTELSSFPSPSPSSPIRSIQFKTDSPTPFPWKFFESTEELYEAVDAYLDNDSPTSVTAQVYGHPIGTWQVGRLANFSHVFDADRNAAAGNFTADLSGWDTSRATTMRFMFHKAEHFNGDVSSFDTSSVVDMEAMFFECRDFDSNISHWRTGSVTNFRDFLGRATSFSGDLSDWDTSSATDFSGMCKKSTSETVDACFDGVSLTSIHLCFLHSSINRQLQQQSAELANWIGNK